MEVSDGRAADNDLKRIPSLAASFNFTDEGRRLKDFRERPSTGLTVVKVGIKTGLTMGNIIDEIDVRWDPSMTAMVASDDLRHIPSSKAYGVIGLSRSDPQDPTSYLEFARPGDSGAVVIGVSEEEEGGPVDRCEAIGILYGIVMEKRKRVYVGLYMPMDDIYKEVHKTGLKISVESVELDDLASSSWEFHEYGEGWVVDDVR